MAAAAVSVAVPSFPVMRRTLNPSATEGLEPRYMAYSSVTKQIFSADQSTMTNEVDAINVMTGTVAFTLRHDSIVTAMCVCQTHGTIFTGCEDGTIMAWSSEGEELCSVGEDISTAITMMSLSSDGNLLVTNGEAKDVPHSGVDDRHYTEVLIWQLSPTDGVLTRKGTITFEDHPVACFSVSPGGEMLAIGFAEENDDGEGVVLVLKVNPDYTCSQYKKLTKHTGGITHLRFSPSGERLISGSLDCSACVWDLSRTKNKYRFNEIDPETFDGDRPYINVMTLSQDGTYLALSCADGVARVYDVATGTAARTVDFGEDDCVNVAVVSSSGKYIVTGGDGGIKVVSMETGEVVRRVKSARVVAMEVIDAVVVSFCEDGAYVTCRVA